MPEKCRNNRCSGILMIFIFGSPSFERIMVKLDRAAQLLAMTYSNRPLLSSQMIIDLLGDSEFTASCAFNF